MPTLPPMVSSGSAVVALRSMVMFTLGTGIGCGIVVDDLVLRGEHSHGAECGHIVIHCRADAPVCSCGQRGHLEAFCSAKGVVRRVNEALAAGRPSSLTARQRTDHATRPGPGRRGWR